MVSGAQHRRLADRLEVKLGDRLASFETVGANVDTVGMDQAQHRWQVVGDGAGRNLEKAFSYIDNLASTNSSTDEVLSELSDRIESARAALDECLRGYDSFDVLAFLRMSAELVPSLVEVEVAVPA